jgi:hypothetical protein
MEGGGSVPLNGQFDDGGKGQGNANNMETKDKYEGQGGHNIKTEHENSGHVEGGGSVTVNGQFNDEGKGQGNTGNIETENEFEGEQGKSGHSGQAGKVDHLRAFGSGGIDDEGGGGKGR